MMEALLPFPTGDTQTCRICGVDLPIHSFSRNGRTDGYRRPECRSCQSNRSKTNNPRYQQTEGAIAARKRHTIPAREVEKIKLSKLVEQAGECVYCTAQLTLAESHLDHKIPLARQGSHALENLQVLCARCNSEKHAKTHEEYVAWLIRQGLHMTADRIGKLS